MTRIIIICEGPTEELFVNKVLYPHFLSRNILVSARNLGTGNQYDKLRADALQVMKSDTSAYVTTLVDVYGMNDEFPGYKAHKNKRPYDKVTEIEKAVKADIDGEEMDERQFIPHFQLHEFEAMLYSDPDTLHDWVSLDRPIKAGIFQSTRDSFDSPEHINDDPSTAPSKRILHAAPSFSKVAEGVLIAEDIGLAKIREECRHFDEWITELEALASKKT